MVFILSDIVVGIAVGIVVAIASRTTVKVIGYDYCFSCSSFSCSYYLQHADRELHLVDSYSVSHTWFSRAFNFFLGGAHLSFRAGRLEGLVWV